MGDQKPLELRALGLMLSFEGDSEGASLPGHAEVRGEGPYMKTNGKEAGFVRNPAGLLKPGSKCPSPYSPDFCVSWEIGTT